MPPLNPALPVQDRGQRPYRLRKRMTHGRLRRARGRSRPVTLVEPGTTLFEPGGTTLYGPALATVSSQQVATIHQVNYPFESDDGVISHPLDPEVPWMWPTTEADALVLSLYTGHRLACPDNTANAFSIGGVRPVQGEVRKLSRMLCRKSLRQRRGVRPPRLFVTRRCVTEMLRGIGGCSLKGSDHARYPWRTLQR